MNEDQDLVDEQLRRLRPVAPSREFEQSLAQRMMNVTSARPHRQSVVLALAAAAAVVALALGNVWRHSDPQQRLPAFHHTIQVDELRRWPTALAYRVSLAESPAALDRLLDEHARVLLPPVDPDRTERKPVMDEFPF